MQTSFQTRNILTLTTGEWPRILKKGFHSAIPSGTCPLIYLQASAITSSPCIRPASGIKRTLLEANRTGKGTQVQTANMSLGDVSGNGNRG